MNGVVLKIATWAAAGLAVWLLIVVVVRIVTA